MARLPELEKFSEREGLLIISIAELIKYRRQSEKLVRRIAEARIPTEWGDFTCYAYESVLNHDQHLAFVRGAPSGEENVLVRMHSEYGIGAQILTDLGITTMRLLTNNPAKYGGLDGFGLEIVERVSLQVAPNPENIHYLRTKKDRMGHLLEGLDDVL